MRLHHLHHLHYLYHRYTSGPNPFAATPNHRAQCQHRRSLRLRQTARSGNIGALIRTRYPQHCHKWVTLANGGLQRWDELVARQ